MKPIRILCLAWWVGLIFLETHFLCFAQEEKRIAEVTEVEGTVEYKTSTGKWTPAAVGTILAQGDLIRTKADSWALLSLDGKAETATVEVKENSQMKLADLSADKSEGSQKTLLDLALGEVLIDAKKLSSEKSKFEVKTPTSVVGVRGTNFSVTVEALE